MGKEDCFNGYAHEIDRKRNCTYVSPKTLHPLLNYIPYVLLCISYDIHGYL